jgi:hypothetical protein
MVITMILIIIISKMDCIDILGVSPWIAIYIFIG